MLSDRQSLRLIQATHRAALDPACWQDVTEELHRVTEESPIGLHKLYARNGHIVTAAAAGYAPDFVKSYGEHYATLSPWIECFRTYPERRALLVAEMDLPVDFERSEFYNDWVLPQDIRFGASIRTRSAGSRALIVGISTRARDRDRLEQFSQRLLTWLEPHLAHALAVNEEMARLSAGAILPAAVAAPPSAGGILIVTTGRLLCWADAGAVTLFGEVLRLASSSRLGFADPDAQDWFEAVTAFAETPGRSAMRPRLETVIRSNGRNWTVRALHCDDQLAARVSFPAFLMEIRPPGSRALALVIAPKDAGKDAASHLRQRFGLSSVETEVALRIAEGLDTDQIAAKRGVSRHTVRNQIQSILSKTGARHRGDLIRLLSRMPMEN